ncbi:hypothetical protein [Streptomyces sp. NPDC001070]
MDVPVLTGRFLLAPPVPGRGVGRLTGTGVPWSDVEAGQGEMIRFLKDPSPAGTYPMPLASLSRAGHELGLVVTGPLPRIP